MISKRSYDGYLEGSLSQSEAADEHMGAERASNDQNSVSGDVKLKQNRLHTDERYHSTYLRSYRPIKS